MNKNMFHQSMNISNNIVKETNLSLKKNDIEVVDEEMKFLMSCSLFNDTKNKLDDQFNVINRIATDKSLMVKSIALNNSSYLLPRKIKNITEEIFLRQCVTQINQECLNNLKAEIDSCPLSNKSCDDKVLFNTIGMINSYENQNTKFIWRRVKGDGNCFYRAVIFSYLEQMILKNRKQEMINFIYDFKMITKTPQFIKLATDLKLDIEYCLNCLIMLHFSLNAKSRDAIKKSYITFLKMMNNYRNLDYCLICFYHIMIYEYLKENQFKLYSEEFSVFLANLLPAQYEDNEGNANWNKFYEDFLFKFYTEAEKIVIYLTPYIFNISLEILYYDEIKNERKILIFNPSNYSSALPVISVLYKKVHYDIIYNEEMFTKYEPYLSINFYSIKNNLNCINCQGTVKLIKLQNIFVCEECLFAEIKSVIHLIFLFYIQNNLRYYLQKFDPIANLKTYMVNFNSFVYFTIEEGLNILKNEKTFDGLINELKETLCVVCYQQFQYSKKDLKLPCNCCFCSMECMKKYHDLIEPISITKSNYICFCNTTYTPQQIMQTIELFDNYNYKSDCLIRLFQIKTYRVCYICLETMPFIEKGYLTIHFVKNIRFKSNIKLHHSICEKCIAKIGEQNKDKKPTIRQCNLCNDEFTLVSTRQIHNTEDYKDI